VALIFEGFMLFHAYTHPPTSYVLPNKPCRKIEKLQACFIPSQMVGYFS